MLFSRSLLDNPWKETILSRLVCPRLMESKWVGISSQSARQESSWLLALPHSGGAVNWTLSRFPYAPCTLVFLEPGLTLTSTIRTLSEDLTSTTGSLCLLPDCKNHPLPLPLHLPLHLPRCPRCRGPLCYWR